MNIAIIFGALILSAALYGAIAYLKSRDIHTVDDFFHIHDVNRGFLSIVAGNLTLGTGLVYIASLAQSQALFALVAPAGVLVGYLLLSRLVSSLSISDSSENHDVLDFLDCGPGGKLLSKSISLIMAATYLVLIPLEIYVSANLFSALFVTEDASLMAPVFGATIFTIVIVYSAIGGLRGIVATDVLQFVFMLGLVLIILIGAALFSSDGGGTPVSLWPKQNFIAVGLLTISTFVTAVATQFYNVINVTVGNSFDSQEQKVMFLKTGLTLSAVLALLVFTGVYAASLGSSPFGSIDILLSKLGDLSHGYFNLTVIFLVVFGMVAVLISSADSGFIAISHTVYEKVIGKSSRERAGGSKLLSVRLFYVVAINAAAAIPLIIIFQREPNIISLLVSSISALTVSAPLIASAAYCSSRFQVSIFHRLPAAIAALIVVLITWGMSISSTLSNETDKGHLVVIVGVILAMILACVDYFLSKAK